MELEFTLTWAGQQRHASLPHSMLPPVHNAGPGPLQSHAGGSEKLLYKGSQGVLWG